MTTGYNYDRVLEDIRTLEDLRLMASEIDMLMVSLYNANDQTFLTTLNNNIQRNLTDSLTLSLNEQQVSLTNHEQLERYFTGLKAYIMKLPVLQLTLAYRPANHHIVELSEWVRRETNKPVILQIHYNSDLVGGAVITYEGKYVDLSLKKKLSRVYETKREEMLKMLG